jgi:hypothetical protein
MIRNPAFVLKPHTHKELAYQYGVSWVTFQKWLSPFINDIGPKKGNFYTTRQVEIIIDKLGKPICEL